MQAGAHQLKWNAIQEKGNMVVAGIYFVKMNAGAFSKTQKLIFIK